MFEHILGHLPLKSYLQKALRENRVPQTLLFAGLDGIGKSLFAKSLAAALLKSDRSPDLHLLSPEGKSSLYAIDTLREMIDKEHSAPFEAPGKVFILQDAERMQPACSNILLKTLEEPTEDTTFILLTSAPQDLLPTILSRCITLQFQPLTTPDIATLLQAKGHPTHFAPLAQGSAGRAFELAENPILEEQRKILFQILAQKPSYPEVSLLLEKLDEEESTQRGEYLFTYLLMWHRDQHARQFGAKLFFPDEPACEPVSLQKVEKALEKARLAYQRNIKLSSCIKTAINL